MSERINTPFTNEHFADWCQKMVGQPYWYGTCVYKATSSLLSRKSNQYPSHYGSSRTSRYKQDIANKAVVSECIGGCKGYAWTGGGQGVLEAIKRVQIKQSKPLTCLNPHGNPFPGRHLVTVNDVKEKLQRSRIVNNCRESLLQDLMINAVKELADVTLQKVPSCSMPAEMIMHESVEPVNCKEGSFSGPAGRVVIDEMILEVRSQHIVTKAVLQNPVTIVQSVDLPDLRIMDGEVIVATKPISLRPESFL